MIGAVTFHPEEKYVGGAQVPTFAFYRWCSILGIDCEIIDYWDIESLNECDWIFFGTPGRMNTIPPAYKFSINDISVPFVYMVHAEFDLSLYDEWHDFMGHEMCNAVVIIGNDYWQMDVPEFYWHPCTLPEYLLKEEHEFDNSNRYGLLYAARLSRWKGMDKLEPLSRFKDFATAVDNRIDVFGEGLIDLQGGNYRLHRVAFSIKDFEEIEKRNSQYKYFWDVCGNAEYQFDIKRLNLAAVEAVRFGCIPIVDKNSVYPFALDFCVTLENGFPKNFYSAQENMKEKVLESPMSYDSVKAQVEKIIDYMENAT